MTTTQHLDLIEASVRMWERETRRVIRARNRKQAREIKARLRIERGNLERITEV